ncbi:TorF family putative porin [Novosphingobium piscinae]|uniref:Cellulose biosynthesis protein BcsS n=1 Tax=Novosphingobium piscinae TaxID=1507448 RepID=A0A7X1KQD9_9SPHN|nr:TorF family putative porin [Novosphingobium piscinae]MBC2669659.1 hypothetical protein [Novosphingobium piscinae]
MNRWRRVVLAGMLIAVNACPTPASAQLAGTLSLASNQMFRGESVSRDGPTVSLGLNLDSPEGFYLGASASVAVNGDAARVSTAEQYAGFARRIGETSIEIGAIHRSYERVIDEDYRRGFFEGYVGIVHRRLRARLYVSPDYLRSGPPTYYVDLNARLLSLGPWSLEGHGGLSLIPALQPDGSRKLDRFQDWRLQVSRPVERLLVSTGVSATNYPVYSESGRIRAYAAVMVAF